MRLLKFILLTILLLILAGLILTATPTGLHGSIWIAQRALPGELTVDSIGGRLSDRFAFGHLHYHDSELDIVVDDFRFSWRPLALVNGLLDVQSLSAGRVSITTQAREQPIDDIHLPELLPPVAVRLQQLDIQTLQLEQQAATEQASPLTLQDIRAAAHTRDTRLVIDHLSLRGHQEDHRFELATDGHLQLIQPWLHDLTTTLTVSPPNQPIIHGRINSRGDITDLTVDATTSAPAKARLRIHARNLLQNPDWQAQLNTDSADLSPWLDAEVPTILTADINADGDGNSIGARADLTLTGDTEAELQVTTDLQLEDVRRIDIRHLSLQSPDPAVQLDLSGELDYRAGPTVDLQGRWSLERPGNIHGDVAFSGSADEYRFRIDAQNEQPFASSWQLSGRGNSRGVNIDKLTGQLPAGNVSADGRIDWQHEPAVELAGHWRDIVLPVTDKQLRLPGGRFNVEGTAQAYSATAEGRLEGPAVPAIDWRADVSGDQRQLAIEQLRLALLDGEITATGQAGWSNEPSLSADIRLQQINPGVHWPDWPGQLNGRAQVKLQKPSADWLAEIDNLSLEGRLRGHPVTAAGGLTTAAGTYHFRDLQIRSADSKLQVDGRLGAESDLAWSFSSPDLGQLLPDTGGRLEAGGKLTGDYRHPELNSTLNAGNIQSPWLNLAELQADVTIRSARDQFSVAITAADIQRDQQSIDRLVIQSSGGLSQHDLSTTIGAGKRSLELAGSGQWQEGVWSLNMDQGHYNGPVAGDWQLTPPLQLSLSRQNLQAPEHCWRQSPASLCLGANWQYAGDWQGHVDLQDLALDDLPTDADMPALTGRLAVSLDARGDAQTLQQADGEIRLRDLGVRPDQDTELQISRLDTTLTGDGTGLVLNIDGQFAEPAPGDLSGKIQTGSLDLTQITATSLRGDIHADIRDLRPWLTLYPRLTAEQAQLKMDFAISGQIAAPQLDGDMLLSASDATIPELGITLQTFELNVIGQPQDGLRLAGKASSGPGELTIDGRVKVADGALALPALQIRGERFELINLPQVRLLASPDLQLQYSDKLLDVTGEVTVPEALIQPFGAPGTIAVSDDEYIVTEQEDTIKTALKTRANITLKLGDKVEVSGRGFNSRLEGQLDIRQEPGQPASAVGELQVVDGGYSAYGQELNIRSGKIIFTNQPLDNPAIQAEAVRHVGDITVGVRADGTAQQPVTELFSTPTMPEADILSYLIVGSPLSGASSGEGDILMKAAASMGIKRSEGLRQRIASTFGLDTLSVDTGTTDSGETDTRLVIGKYLSPDLYLSYGAGLVGTAANAVKLRYEINRHLSLEAEQGTGTTGVDLLYQIESGGWGN